MICFFLVLCLASLSALGQNKPFYLKASTGYIGGKADYRGVATELAVGYLPIKYASVELALDNWYRYDPNTSCDTNTGISLVLHAYPVKIQRHTLDLFAGYGFNQIYWILHSDEYKYTSFGRYMYRDFVWGAGYYYSFKSFDLGFMYKAQKFNDLVENRGEQYLLSIKKNF
jgi:hypothetical protein